jgi:hypothetical protein
MDLMNQSKNIEEKRLPVNVMEQVAFFTLCLNYMVEYEDQLRDMEEKQLVYHEFEKYDVKVKLPKRTVKNCYPKKRLSKKTKACRAKRSSNRSRTHQHGERDWDVQKTIEQDAFETMRQEIEDEKDYMKHEIEDENERVKSYNSRFNRK